MGGPRSCTVGDIFANLGRRFGIVGSSETNDLHGAVDHLLELVRPRRPLAHQDVGAAFHVQRIERLAVLGVALEHGVEVHLLEPGPPVVDGPAWHDLQAGQELLGEPPAGAKISFTAGMKGDLMKTLEGTGDLR